MIYLSKADIKKSREYKTIKLFYAYNVANRSGVPLISGKAQEDLARISRQIFEQESKPEIEKLRQDVDFLLKERQKAHYALWNSRKSFLTDDVVRNEIPEEVLSTVGTELIGRLRSDFARRLDEQIFREEMERRKQEKA